VPVSFLRTFFLLTNISSQEYILSPFTRGNPKSTPTWSSVLSHLYLTLSSFPKVKRVRFVYTLELLSRKGDMVFFELREHGHKANNA